MSHVHPTPGRHYSTSSPGQRSDTAEHPNSFYASDVLGRPVVSTTGGHLGHVSDVLCAHAESRSVSLDAVVVTARDTSKHFPPDGFIELRTAATLTVVDTNSRAMRTVPRWMSVRHDLLDRQVVDLEDERVVRINDVLFTSERPSTWAVHGALVGAVGITRRLLPRRFRSQRLLPHAHWGNLEQVPTMRPGGVDVVHLTRLADLPAKSLAHILDTLPPRQAGAIVATLGGNSLTNVLDSVSQGRRLTLARLLETSPRRPDDRETVS